MVIVVILAFLESNNLSRIYIYLCIWQNSICAWADSPVRRESSFVVSCFHFILSIQKQISNLTRYIANNQRKSCMKVCLTAGFSMLSLWFYPLTRYVRPCLVCWSMRLCPNCEMLHCNIGTLALFRGFGEDGSAKQERGRSQQGREDDDVHRRHHSGVYPNCSCARGVHRIYSILKRH